MAIEIYRCKHMGEDIFDLNGDPLACKYCVKPNTIIAGDYKPITEISVGDKVLGTRRHVNVLETYSRPYSGDMIRITARGGLPIELTPEHPVLVVTGVFKYINRTRRVTLTKPYWKMAKDVVPCIPNRKRIFRSEYITGDYLLIPRIKGEISISEVSLDDFTSEHGKLTINGMIAKKRFASLTFPLNTDTAWLLGLYVAEGYAGEKGTEVVFSLGKHEQDLIEQTCERISKLGYKPAIANRKTTTIVKIQSRVLNRAFRAWCGCGASNKHIPYFILYHSNLDLLKAFFEGYIAGDGSRNKDRIQAYTTSQILALQLQLLCARLGYKLCIRVFFISPL